MKATIETTLAEIEKAGNFRNIPLENQRPGLIDFTSNDYLGLASREDLRHEFLTTHDVEKMLFTASASRLLAGNQNVYTCFESFLSDLYNGRPALLFNSGYHANTGLVSALSTKDTVIIADKLVHASIIDGIRLGGARFERFRHNDLGHLERLAKRVVDEGRSPLIVVESVYSMDGDRADIEAIAEIKRRTPGAMLYVDEAHAVGVEGPSGLGLSKDSTAFDDVDILIGTLGKALASSGAFAILKGRLRDFAVNKARSLIFSTAIAPVNVEWSRFMLEKSLAMDNERQHLRKLAAKLADILRASGASVEASHIQPFIVGDPRQAIELSEHLRNEGFNVLPIRTPTVPPGTDRLRLSLSASLKMQDIDEFGKVLSKVLESKE